MDDQDPQMRSLVFSLIQPEQVFRRQTVRRIVNEFLKRYGQDVLVDFLIAVDSTDLLASLIVLDRSEVDEYMFTKYGIFADDMMVKIQMTDRWSKFIHDVVEQSGDAIQEAIDEVMRSEGS
jgi:hypothetical protein